MSWVREDEVAERATGPRFRAQLFGGNGDGLVVDLPHLDATITVFRNGGPPFVLAADVEPGAEQDANLLGRYELVGPIGPETPVYIPAA
jgi:hypothetical protein